MLNKNLLSAADRNHAMFDDLRTYYRKKHDFYHSAAQDFRVFMIHYDFNEHDLANMMIEFTKRDGDLNRLITRTLHVSDERREETLRRIFCLIVVGNGEKK